jgi:ARG and Rhodanese-Phosphatase-superfamily-associated Protein domain
MDILQEEFPHIEIGQSSQFRNLTLFPLMCPSLPVRELDYLLLEDGIAQGKVRVTELQAGGAVSELRVENNADLPVLLVDGEELVGAKQNRVLNLTILVPAKHTTVIPVSCVEAGRWNMASPELKSAGHVMYSFLRSAQLTQVTESMRSHGTHMSDQGAVWKDIAAKAARMTASSPTGAMSAIYERHANSVEEFTRAFKWREGQCGIAFGIAGRILGLEIFDHPQVMRRFFEKLVRSYALDALDEAQTGNEPARVDSVRGVVAQMGTAQSFTEQALGLGKDVRFNGPGISGAALWAEGRYVHICSFVKDEKSSAPNSWTRFTRASHRRTFRNT